MTYNNRIIAIYDFEIFPYALGDVLTWNVRTAMRCEELGRKYVDVYICIDKRYPSGIYQRGLVTPQNFELFFSELYSAFGTHPRLGNIHIFRQREALIDQLKTDVANDEINAESVQDYLSVLGHRDSESAGNKARLAFSKYFRENRIVHRFFKYCLPSTVKEAVRNTCLPSEEMINRYFIKYIHSHESINEFAAKRGRIPLLKPAIGCAPDIQELIGKKFSGKKVVSFHLRLRRLDIGYGGEHTYPRDSDFLEWYEFLREANSRHPNIEFIALGRLQEKPLEILQLPNVTSLRLLGMGLGHELTLMLKSDLFIGTSSGFAALANFSTIPYFITKMIPESCRAYAIPDGSDRLPFAQENQKLIYESESSELLMDLLEQGIGVSTDQGSNYQVQTQDPEAKEIDVHTWLKARSVSANSSATTYRFNTDENYGHGEAAFLILPHLDKARQAVVSNDRKEANNIIRRIEENFPEICLKMPQYLVLKKALSTKKTDIKLTQACLESFDVQADDLVGTSCFNDTAESSGWRPLNWIVENGSFKPLPEEPGPALKFRASGANSYWHIEKFSTDHSDGKIIVRFEAKTSLATSRHRMWIFENGDYRSVGSLVTNNTWRTFDIPIYTTIGSLLELQIDQPDDWQWLSIRDFQVIGGRQLPLVRQTPVTIPMVDFRGVGVEDISCAENDEPDCRQWVVTGKGFVQTPVLPRPGKGGMLISFEARAERIAKNFASIYIFEGEKFRSVANYAFGPAWQVYSLPLQPDHTKPNKIQIDCPESLDSLLIRKFQVIPVIDNENN